MGEKENEETNKGKNTSQRDAAATVTNANMVPKELEFSSSRDNASAAAASALAFHQRRQALREALFENARRRTELCRTDNDKPLTNSTTTTPTVVEEERVEDRQRLNLLPREDDV